MKNVHQLLKDKESEAGMVRQQIAALRQVIPLLVESRATAAVAAAKPTAEQVGQWKEALQLAAPLLADEGDDLVSSLRARKFQAAARGK